MSSKGKPAVGYARRSTDMQERSIPDQQAYVEKWAKENGYRITRWFIDDAISGTSTRGRDSFEQLISAAENGRDFDYILCYDISRFSRGGTNETGYYLHRLRLAGVDVIFTADGIPEGDEGELIQGVKSWQARQYSVKLARDTIRGQISNIRERKSAPGGIAPYGYDKQHLTADGKVLRTLRWMPDGSKQEFGPDGKLLRVIDAGVNIKKAKSDIIRLVPSTKDRVDTIKRIYRMCLEGLGFHSIAAALNRDGVPSPTGQAWSTSRVAKLIKNPVYKGAICWNKHSMGSLFGLDGNGVLRPRQKRGWKQNGQADWIISEGVHDPLVSAEKWDAAQVETKRRATLAGQARPTNRSLLSSLMKCKRCGCGFTHVRDRRCPGPEGDGYRGYRCCGYHRYGKSTCEFYQVRAPWIEKNTVEAIKAVVRGEHGDIQDAIEAFIKCVRRPANDEKPSKGNAEELALLNRKIKATVGMLADPAFDGLDELKATLAELKAKRDALEAKAAKTKNIATKVPSADELRRWATERFGRIDEFVCKPTPTLQDRQLIEAFVDRIEIDPEAKHATIYLYADLESAYEHAFTREPIGDFMGAHEWCQPPDTMVQTAGGTSTLGQMRDDDRVVSFYSHSSAIVGLRDGYRVKVGRRPYGGKLYGVTTPAKQSWGTDGHIWTVRMTQDYASRWCVYLMRRGTWWRVGMTKMRTTWGFGVKGRLLHELGDEAWILSLHDSAAEARMQEQLVSIQFGIPQTCWVTNRSSTHRQSDHIRDFYSQLDADAQEAAACNVLAHFNRNRKYPFVESNDTRAKFGARQSIQVRSCNLIPGSMEVPTPTRGQRVEWTPIRAVDVQDYSGEVVSLGVDTHEHYIADGLVTHNCFYGWLEGAAHVYLGPNNATDLWQIKKVNPQSMVHLTEKPVELAVRAMQYSSRPGENVLDLFGGSGSTLIAAEQTGRHAYLMELDPLYSDVIVDRYQRFTGKPAVLERTGTSPIPMRAADAK